MQSISDSQVYCQPKVAAVCNASSAGVQESFVGEGTASAEIASTSTSRKRAVVSLLSTLNPHCSYGAGPTPVRYDSGTSWANGCEPLTGLCSVLGVT